MYKVKGFELTETEHNRLLDYMLRNNLNQANTELIIRAKENKL